MAIGNGVGPPFNKIFLNGSYVLNEQFSLPEVAPVASPRNCVPGGGTLTFVQNDGQFSITGGRLRFPAQATPVFGDLGFYSQEITRAAGLSIYGEIELTTLEYIAISLSSGIGLTAADNDGGNFVIANTGIIFFQYPGFSFTVISGIVIGRKYKFALVMRATGLYIVLDNYLIFINSTINTAVLRAKLTNLSAAGYLEYFKIKQIGGVWSAAEGFRIYNNAAPVDGVEPLIEANFYTEFSWTPVGVEVLEFSVRRTDDNNRIAVRCDGAGHTIKIITVDGGVETENFSVAYGFVPNIQAEVLKIAMQDDMIILKCRNSDLTIMTGIVKNQAVAGAKVENFTAGTLLNVWKRDVNFPFDGLLPETIILTMGDSKTWSQGWQPAFILNMEAVSTHQYKYEVIATNGITVAIERTQIDAELAAVNYVPESILICLGANDVIVLPAELQFKADYSYIIDALHVKWPDANIYLSRTWRRGFAANSVTLGTWINDVANLYSFVFVADDEKVWLEGGDDGNTMSSDGVHYSAAGNIMKASLMKTVLIP